MMENSIKHFFALTHARAGRSTKPLQDFHFEIFCQKTWSCQLQLASRPCIPSSSLFPDDAPLQVLKVAHSQLFIRLASCQSLRSSNATFTAVDTLDLNRIGFPRHLLLPLSLSLFFSFFCSNSQYFMNFLINARAKRDEKFTCKVASCDNDRRRVDSPAPPTTKKKKQPGCGRRQEEAACMCVCVAHFVSLPCRLSQFVTEVSAGAGDKKLLTWYEWSTRCYWWPPSRHCRHCSLL